jgi:N-acetylglucosamine kinase-like BadF-type ATPase
LSTAKGGLQAVIGVDAGGTKTAGACAIPGEEPFASFTGGPANYQSVGADIARENLAEVVSALLEAARGRGLEVGAAVYGIAGLDRPKDDEVIASILRSFHPPELPSDLVNDTFLIVRAGTRDGVGVAVVSGTGSNCAGVGRDGERTRIGGLGWEFGDGSGAGDIGTLAMRAAFRGQDGRDPATDLGAAFVQRLGLQRLDDLVDAFVADAPDPLDPGRLAPLVFEVAARGDKVAHGILAEAGRDLGRMASIVAGRLFEPGESFPLVLGGSVLQQGSFDAMRDALADEVGSRFPRVRPIQLVRPPLDGALLLAGDMLRGAAPATGGLL